MVQQLPRSAFLAQAAVVACAIVGTALSPPARGAMLLVPLTGRLAGPVDAAVAGGAALLGRGPLPGSLIVVGTRAQLVDATVGQGILVLSAPVAMCGPAAGARASA